MRADGTGDAWEREIDALVGEGGPIRAGFDSETAGFDLGFDVGAKFVKAGADGALQLWRGGFEPIVRDLGEDAGFAPEPPVTKYFPIGFGVNGLELPFEVGTEYRKTNWDLLGLCNTESREWPIETEVSRLHNREIDYTEGHDTSCPTIEIRRLEAGAT